MSTVYEIGRYEFKYVVPALRRSEMLDLIAPYVTLDPHAYSLPDGGYGYRVHSLYFDTPDLQDYFDRIDRRKVRNRLRIRTYGQLGEQQPVFLENKRKSGRWVVKHRVCVGDADTWVSDLDSRPWLELDRHLRGKGRFAAHSFNTLVNGARRIPVSVVHYQREVFIPRQPRQGNHVRLTLDRYVRASSAPAPWDFFLAGAVELIPADWMVMEIKFNRLAPAWMVALRRHLDLHAVPVSKYGLSIAKTLRQGRAHELRLLTPPPLIGKEGP